METSEVDEAITPTEGAAAEGEAGEDRTENATNGQHHIKYTRIHLKISVTCS